MARAVGVLLSVVLVSVTSLVDAQTLDELQHPLMPRGKASATVDYEYYAVDVLAGDFAGTFTVNYSRPQRVLVPQVRIGLANGLELRLDGTNQFRTIFSDPAFAVWLPGRHSLSSTSLRSAAATLLSRPMANLELRGFYRWGRAQDLMNYSATDVIEAYDTETSVTNVMALGGTWLSTADGHNRLLKSDLDGLHHPLLKHRRVRFDWDVMRRWYDSTWSSTAPPEVIDSSSRSADTRMWLGIAHGLTDHVQIRGDGYWHPAFSMSERSQLSWTYYGNTQTSTALLSTRYQGVYGWRVNGVWRPTARGEVFAEGTQQQERIAHDSSARSGALQTTQTRTVRFGGSWLLGRPTRSATVTADLAGLFHPLVEPKQIELNVTVDHFGYRGDVYVPDAWLWRLQATTGIWSGLQATAYGGMMVVKRAPSFVEPVATIERHSSLGAQLTLRMLGRIEAFSSVHLRPGGLFDAYPVFILGRDDPYRAYHDVMSTEFGGDRTFHVGLRFVL